MPWLPFPFCGAAIQPRRVLVTNNGELMQPPRAAHRDADPKRVYYLSMEFLMGRSLTNALNNLGVVNQYTEALREMGYSIEARPNPSCSPVQTMIAEGLEDVMRLAV